MTAAELHQRNTKKQDMFTFCDQLFRACGLDTWQRCSSPLHPRDPKIPEDDACTFGHIFFEPRKRKKRKSRCKTLERIDTKK
jgi:hypothetical protein